MLDMIDMLLTNHNRPRKKLIKLKGVVVHCAENAEAGIGAAANRDYFNSTARAVSTHYIVDDNSIVRCLPDDELGYHVGAVRYTKIGEGLLEGHYSPNFFLIGIAMCISAERDWNKTYRNTVKLVAYLMRKHRLSADNLYRHYDISGKCCPEVMLEDQRWNDFKVDVTKELLRVKLVFNGRSLDIPMTIRDGIIYTPIMPIAELLNASARWDQDLYTVFIDSKS